MSRLFYRPLLAICTVLVCGSVYAQSETAEEKVPFPEVVKVEEPSEPANLLEEVLPSLTEQIGFYNPEDAYLYRLHNDTYYHLFAYSGSGDVLELHDHSRWAVHPNQQYTVFTWVQSDNIFIKPQYSWFSSYKYILQNYTTQQSVEVNLISPPPPMGYGVFHIVNLDPYNYRVFLSDNTVWQVDSWDYNFSKWQIGQRLMVGVDNYWTTATYPNILINIDLYGDPYSRANFYGYPIGY